MRRQELLLWTPTRRSRRSARPTAVSSKSSTSPESLSHSSTGLPGSTSKAATWARSKQPSVESRKSAGDWKPESFNLAANQPAQIALQQIRHGQLQLWFLLV